ncbi:MAG: STAS domain-containing protein [Methylobacter sp.]|nr:STAS domain-containing protein [Methylobacter sp.]
MQTLDIEGELTIFTAADQKPQLLAFLESGDELEVNLAGVTEIDSAGLQLLILIKREAAHAGKTLRFVMHSKVVVDILELTKLTTAFGDPVVLAYNEE